MHLIEPIKKTRIPEAIADQIRTLIYNGTFKAGEPLPPERILAQRFEVSRGSVRDAFRMLETVGLLESRHGQGTFPNELDVGKLVSPFASVLAFSGRLQEELLDVRLMFEPAVARVAAIRITPEELRYLGQIIKEQRVKSKAGESTIVEDTAFHATLAKATHNQVVKRIMQILNELLVESRTHTLRQRGRVQRSIRGHANVLAALKTGDDKGAARAMTEHIDQIGEIVNRSSRSRA